MDFAAFYLISANEHRSSICNVGLTIVKNNCIDEHFSYYVRPVPYEFDSYNVDLYSLDETAYVSAKSFPEVWEDVKEKIGKLPMFTFFTSFQNSLYKRTMAAYNIECTSEYKPEDVWKLAYGYNPDFLCHSFKYVVSKLHIPVDFSLPSSMSDAVAFMLLHYAASLNSSSLAELYDRLPSIYHGGGVIKKSIFSGDVDIEESELVKDRFFCFTGEMQYCKRDDAKKIVIESGGQTTDSVTSKTNYLVIGKKEYINEDGKPSSKVQKAMKLRAENKPISIISEEEFLQMVIIKR